MELGSRDFGVTSPAAGSVVSAGFDRAMPVGATPDRSGTGSDASCHPADVAASSFRIAIAFSNAVPLSWEGADGASQVQHGYRPIRTENPGGGDALL